MRKIFFFAISSILMLMMNGCRPSVPNDYIQPGDMEDILYDYHVAQALANQDNGSGGINKANYNQQLYIDAVFKKHGITEAEFDTSLVYYMRHTERLHGIYENLSKRLADDALKLGANATDVNKYNVLTNKGDTANIWAGEKFAVLTTYAPYNKVTFKMEADTTFKKGDSFLLDFDAYFVFQDGIKDGVAALAVKYDNDSISSQTIHLSSSETYQIRIPENDGHNIKEISGFIFLGKGGTSVSTLKLMFINYINLVRFHKLTDKFKAGASTHQDSSNVGTTPSPNTTGAPQPRPMEIDTSVKVAMPHKRGQAIQMK